MSELKTFLVWLERNARDHNGYSDSSIALSPYKLLEYYWQYEAEEQADEDNWFSSDSR